MRFAPTRSDGLARLEAFLPQAGRSYARKRNRVPLPDPSSPPPASAPAGPRPLDDSAGPQEQAPHARADTPPDASASHLSPYLRHRLLTEEEVLRAVLDRHGPEAAEKYVEEVFWRIYYKGWLEQRPTVWTAYRAGAATLIERMRRNRDLRRRWEEAVEGRTGLGPFDDWSRELVSTGYLHNQVRMWFASVWIFTLDLPWELGADFFMRHLLDGDAASNTLGWRWVAGIQTRGKPYLVNEEIVERCSQGRWRFAPGELSQKARSIETLADPAPRPLTFKPPALRRRNGLLVHEDDLTPDQVLPPDMPLTDLHFLPSVEHRSVLPPSSAVLGFAQGAIQDCRRRLLPDDDVTTPIAANASIEAAVEWVIRNRIEQVVTPHAPVGPAAERIAELERRLRVQNVPIVRLPRRLDELAWPRATRGFFAFRKEIPALLTEAGIIRPSRAGRGSGGG